jgi:hypothetical protein
MSLPLAIRYVVLGMLAFVCACVSHEAIGHGGACLAGGGRIVLLTSVFFRCEPATSLVDAAGTVMNLAVAGLAWLAFSRFALSSTMRLFAIFVFAFNAMWGTGYFIYSAVLNTGDLAFVWRAYTVAPEWLCRVLLGGVGVFLYSRAMRAMAPRLPPRLPVLLIYFSVGMLAVVSVTLARIDLLAAIREALAESLLASAGLAYLALVSAKSRAANTSAAPPISGWFTMAAVPIIVAFLLLLGRGVVPA